jgi:hypothetical protein
MFVRDHIIGIVWASPVITESPDDPSGEAAAGDSPVIAVAAPVRDLENVVDVASPQWTSLTRDRSEPSGRGNVELTWVYRNEVVFDLPISQRPEDLVCDHDGGSRGLRMPFSIEGHEPQGPLFVAHREARCSARGLGRRNRPSPGCGTFADERAFGGLLAADWPGQDPIGKPVRVWHLVDGVDIARADIKRPVAGTHEQIQGEIDEQVDVPLRHFRRVLCFRLARERIVTVKTRRRALGRGNREHECHRDHCTRPTNVMT